MSGPGGTAKVEVRHVEPQHTASVRQTVDRDNIADDLGRMFQLVTTALARQGVTPIGPPFARYHEWGDEVDLEAGMPVATVIRPDGEVGPSSLPGGRAARALHVGAYEDLRNTYESIEAWMAASGRSASGGPWEVYLTDPSTEPDPRRWATEIIWPLRS